MFIFVVGVLHAGSSPQRVCPVFLDADHSFFTQWSGACSSDAWSESRCQSEQRTTVAYKMLEIYDEAVALLNRQPATLAVTFSGAGTHVRVEHGTTQTAPTTASSTLEDYAVRLAVGVDAFTHPGTPRAPGEPSAPAVCANVLFTHTPFAEASRGIAKLGGACSSRFEREDVTKTHTTATSLPNSGSPESQPPAPPQPAYIFKARNVAAITTMGSQETGTMQCNWHVYA